MPDQQNSVYDQQEFATLQLHKEKLQVSKKWVETADVTIYKNTYTEEKQIIIPVTREELIIEKKMLHPQESIEGQIETIRIPLSEEKIEVTKHPIILEDVEIFKNQFEELTQVHELLKEEKVHIDLVGNVKLSEDLVDGPKDH